MNWNDIVKISGIEKSNCSIFKTKEARKVFDKVCTYISSYFYLPNTKDMIHILSNIEQSFWIENKEYFCNLDTSELAKSEVWRPRYSWIVATENEKMYRQLKEKGIPAQFIDSTHSIDAIEHYDVIRTLECEQFAWAFDKMPQCICINSVDFAAPEHILRELSTKKEIISFAALRLNIPLAEVNATINSLTRAVSLLQQAPVNLLDSKKVELVVHQLNKQLFVELESVQLNGSALLLLMQKQQLPPAVITLMDRLILTTGIAPELFVRQIPIEIDSEMLDLRRREQCTNINLSIAKQLRSENSLLLEVSSELIKLEQFMSAADLVQGVCAFLREHNCVAWSSSDDFVVSNAKNLFLANPQPINFNLTGNETASILTGANSGGKTTLLEHMIQIVSLRYLNLPIPGSAALPAYDSVYYFAKNKGSMNKGAFETLLTQLATIDTCKKTLILADEMEAVTEPSVACRIMAATLNYYIERNCHIIFATHLGGILLEHQPKRSRIDGIEATGLDADGNLLVNHNPVLGKLAKSTPELIIMRLAAKKNPYLQYLASNVPQAKL